MSANAVIVALCSTGAGVMGLISGLLIMFVYKSCRTQSDTNDAEIGPPPPPVPRPREYHYRVDNLNTRPPDISESTPTSCMCNRKSGDYCRISKFDIPVETKDAAIQAGEEKEDTDYVYLVKFEQAVQCDIISAHTLPSPCNSSVTLSEPTDSLSYSAYRRHVRAAFSTWQVLPAAITNQNTGGWTRSDTRQTEVANDSFVLALRLTPEVRCFLHKNGLCETMSLEEITDATCKTVNNREQIQTPVETAYDANVKVDICENVNAMAESLVGDQDTNSEDYVPMDGNNGEDYLPMSNIADSDDYIPIGDQIVSSEDRDDYIPLNQDSYSYLLSRQQRHDSVKSSVECAETTSSVVDTQLSMASDSTEQCTESLKGEDTGDEPSDNEYEYIEDEDYLKMTKRTATNKSYYNCSHLKKDDQEDYVPVNDYTLPRRRESSSHKVPITEVPSPRRCESSTNPDYANYPPLDGYSSNC
ncbi:uncharacterized protein [Argopecten irradians]|uniref:uncharacterized protein isoform X1 n=2 Tax=Argopecten irradians TaxID=31199 RepID=UPI003711D600